VGFTFNTWGLHTSGTHNTTVNASSQWCNTTVLHNAMLMLLPCSNTIAHDASHQRPIHDAFMLSMFFAPQHRTAGTIMQCRTIMPPSNPQTLSSKFVVTRTHICCSAGTTCCRFHSGCFGIRRSVPVGAARASAGSQTLSHQKCCPN